MSARVLDQVNRLLESLSPQEQAQVLASLALRVAQAVAVVPDPVSAAVLGAVEPWDEFLRLGAALATADTPASETMTAAVLASRR